MKTADVVVIGGGIYGTLLFHQLSKHFPRVVLLERAKKVGAGPTARSGAVTRCHYPNVFTARLAFAAIRDAWRVWKDYLGYSAARAEHQGIGVVLIPAPQDAPAVFGKLHAGRGDLAYFKGILERAGVPGIEEIDSRDFLWDNEGLWFDRERIPKVLFETYAGYVREPWLAAVDAAKAACANNKRARVHTGIEVRSVSRRNGTWHVSTTRGTFEAPVVVVAAGAATGRLLESAGVRLRNHRLRLARPEVALVRRQKYFGEFHVTVDLSAQVYFRQQGRDVFTGSLGLEPTRKRPFTEKSFRRRVRRLAQVCVGYDPKAPPKGFVSEYDENDFDNHPVVDEPAPGLYCAWLFSGHGFKFSPIIARDLAAWIATGHKPQGLHELRADRPPIRPD